MLWQLKGNRKFMITAHFESKLLEQSVVDDGVAEPSHCGARSGSGECAPLLLPSRSVSLNIAQACFGISNKCANFYIGLVMVMRKCLDSVHPILFMQFEALPKKPV